MSPRIPSFTSQHGNSSSVAPFPHQRPLSLWYFGVQGKENVKTIDRRRRSRHMNPKTKYQQPVHIPDCRNHLPSSSHSTKNINNPNERRGRTNPSFQSLVTILNAADPKYPFQRNTDCGRLLSPSKASNSLDIPHQNSWQGPLSSPQTHAKRRGLPCAWRVAVKFWCQSSKLSSP